MKSVLQIFILFFLAGIGAKAQTYLSLSDNLVIPDNSNIKILGGTYDLQDTGNDGLIKIDNKHDVIIDGDSVIANGQNYSGYLIEISYSSNILIKNFESGNRFKYGVYVTHSDHIEIDNCNFSLNKTDSSGWIDVWSGYTLALGGGAMFYDCSNVWVHDCIMNLQNDGAALYNCTHAEVDSNDFAWNTSYGIRMYFTDSSSIHDNLASHINRPFTDPSDCAALLMIVSNENIVERNDLSYSGDGVFLGQYQHSSTPCNNYFAYNQCSGSPHNAVEATFADGNIFKHNICDFSEYGFWLGYSYNTIIDSNEINYNQVAGIAIERGFNNSITHCTFLSNPLGVQLWEAGVASGYESWSSHDYIISNNIFEGNTLAISADATENMTMVADSFIKNYTGVFFDQSSSEEHISSCYFDASTTYDIQNNSTYAIDADSNTFIYCDAAFLDDKIYDQSDNITSGVVNISPYECDVIPVYQTTPPADMAEPPANWYVYPEVTWWLGIPEPLAVNWDSSFTHDGVASLHLLTGTGWYNDLCYRPDSNKIAQWDVSNYTHLSFWVYSVDTNLGAFQYYHVRIGNSSGGYFRYNSTGAALNQSLNNWKNYDIPLNGGSGWTKQTVGDISLSDINYVEIWTDSYGVGYELWIDGLSFTEPTGIMQSMVNPLVTSIYPNPMNTEATIYFTNEKPSKISVDLFSVDGEKICNLADKFFDGGNHSIDFDRKALGAGVYFLQIKMESTTEMLKVVVE